MTAATQIDCGTHVLKLLEVLPLKAASCLVTGANAGQSVHLRVQSLTDEGDPVVETYESQTIGIVTVATDYTKDKFGSGQIEHVTCTGPSVADGRMRFDSCS